MGRHTLKRKTQRKHWYLITQYECPDCGRGAISRERKYGKPPKPAQRYKYVQNYDYCLGP